MATVDFYMNPHAMRALDPREDIHPADLPEETRREWRSLDAGEKECEVFEYLKRLPAEQLRRHFLDSRNENFNDYIGRLIVLDQPDEWVW